MPGSDWRKFLCRRRKGTKWHLEWCAARLVSRQLTGSFAAFSNLGDVLQALFGIQYTEKTSEIQRDDSRSLR